MTCETCHFYRTAESELEKGECHRYPPSTKFVNHIDLPCFPPVFKSDWCGEYKANERDAPKPKKTA